MAEIFLTLVSC